MTGRLIAALLIVTVCTAAPFALAHSGATGVVKERMDNMKTMTKSIKGLVPMVQGKVPYAPQAVRDVARVIELHAGQSMLDGFPEGSLQHPTEALPAIWEEWDDFTRQAMRLSVLAQGLALSADVGLKADAAGADTPIANAVSAQDIGRYPVPVVLNAIGEACLACHTDYRLKSE